MNADWPERINCGGAERISSNAHKNGPHRKHNLTMFLASDEDCPKSGLGELRAGI
jgi:hypothetical protein